MEVSKLFESISKKMSLDFEMSADFKQHGNRGSYREDSLKEFLCKGKLPSNFGIVSGEIISQYSQSSKQIDLILYDKSKSIMFESSESTKVFPIESVLGMIEVKSKLSKAKLIEGLENIKSLKELHSPQIININYGDRVRIGYYNTPPFGMIFAFNLSKNSLDSLRKNLAEWCEKNPPEVWPNLICVLNSGIINFYNGPDLALLSSDIKQTSQISAISYNESSLFEFTSALLTLCANRYIEIFDIQRYKKPGLIIDNLRVKFSNELKNSDGARYRLDDAFIKLVYENRGEPILYRDLMDKMLSGFAGDRSYYSNRNDKVYVYDPKKLPTLFEAMSADPSGKPMIEIVQDIPVFTVGIYLYINEESYYVPSHYINNENTCLW